MAGDSGAADPPVQGNHPAPTRARNTRTLATAGAMELGARDAESIVAAERLGMAARDHHQVGQMFEWRLAWPLGAGPG